jgi:trimeric autotransporter adhesin
MSITITQLPSQGTILDTTQIPVETAGITGRISASSIKNYLAAATLSSVTTTSLTVNGSSVTGPISAYSLNTTSDVVVGGNLIIIGSESVAGNILGNITGNLIGSVIGSGGTFGNVVATITLADQPFITNLANIRATSLTTNANISIGTTLYVAGAANIVGVTTYSSNIVPISNAAAVNIGTSSNWFNNVYGTAIHALYADLAERYTSDQQYPPGTVVIFGTDTEVTASKTANDTKVAGVVSTNPAYTMNAGVNGVDVALQGRVPCQVTGTVNRGDLMVTSSIPGVAMASSSPVIGSVIGKALGFHTGSNVGVIEVVVGRI